MQSAGSVVSHGESIGGENADSVESAKSTGGAECSESLSHDECRV